MSKSVDITAAAFVFTDARTGQGYIRQLSEFECRLISQQLASLDDGELKAVPVYPVEIRKMKTGKAS